MNCKKIVIILLLLILSLTAVSAADFNNVTELSADADDSIIVEDSFSESSEIPDSLVSSNSAGTFTDLQALVNNASAGSVLELNMDYKGDKNARIQLNKALTIDGKGHTIDCLEKSGCSAFYSNSGTITLKNLKIINGHNGNTDKGGAIYITGSAQYTIINCTFENNWADDYGGAIYNEGYTLRIKNCTFNSNEADDQSGGAISSKSNLYIENSKFISNSAQIYGGAVYALSSFEVYNSVFESNRADEHTGGAIYNHENLKVVNSTFRKNSVEWIGGAISSFKDAHIYGCLFESNKADGVIVNDVYGGAVNCGGTLYIDNSTFKDNFADDYGGAIAGNEIYINYNQNANQTFNTFFINNEADDDTAGAIHAREKLYVKNTVFSGNNAYVDGGAIYAKDDVTAVHCLFESNKADGAVSQCYGGAICSKDNDVYIENSTFKDNYAEDYGGAIYADAVNINVNQAYPQAFSSFFINNKAGDNKGGAIYAEDDVKAVNAVFSGNYAEVDGGAIYSEDDVAVNNCLFESNKADGATSQCYGGAIRADIVDVENSTFKDNYAEDYGGAIYADSVSINVFQSSQPFNSFFINNKAGDNKGGAIYVDDGDIIAKNTVFSGNKAKVDGGAINGDDNVAVTHCLFENNRAEGASVMSCYGGAFCAHDNAYVDNCTFRNNYAENEGGAIHVNYLQLINTCIFEGNTARDDGGAIWTDIMNGDVSRTIFIGNKAKTGDGGAFYIDNEDEVIFSSNVFVNNTCGDEGGAIYADDMDSKISLKYNIFIGNDAGDTGDSAYVCGNYKDIINNYWGGKNPSKNNGQLIEWMPLFVPNEHHTDEDPLTMSLRMDSTAIVGETVTATHVFYKSDGKQSTAPILNDGVVFDVGRADLKDIRINEYSVSADFVPPEEGSYVISADLYGQSISKKLSVTGIKIIADDIIAYYGGYQTLKIHLEGDIISKKRVDVSFNSKHYVEYTDENGDASVLIDSLPDALGNHDIEINVFGINTTSTITILSTIDGDDFTAGYGNNSQYSITFKDKNGENLKSGFLIRYQFDDSGFKNAFTQDDGLVSFDISSLTPGEHNLTVINMLTKENMTYTVEIMQLVGGILNNDKNNQPNHASYEPADVVSRENQQSNFASSNNDLSYYGNVVEFLPANVVDQLNTANGSADDNQSNNNPVKSINQAKTFLNNNNLYWILLLILLVVLGVFLIRKMR
ncbi:right-handed parallel beta-helix repeat-containing protein [Methanobrevibacter sp.]|uniref:right-handed parallel beta-helix repeat-containing protein n=1 Tax=Methanobrevibacter sp. TaxID=66852 RepID=UPI00388F335F